MAEKPILFNDEMIRAILDGRKTQTLDDNFRVEALKDILDTAGREVGIGDFRPRFGRFIVTGFNAI